jgi:hypothetical protein
VRRRRLTPGSGGAQPACRTKKFMPIVPDQFAPSESAVFPGFLLRALSPEFAAQDFAAVTASASSIRHVFGPENGWPSAGLTFEENNADLARHQREFNERSAFAYSLFDPQGLRYLGCLYLKPIKSRAGRDQRHERFCAQAFLWLSVLHQDVNEPLVHSALSAWFAADWALANVAWPGRSPSWEEWNELSSLPASDGLSTDSSEPAAASELGPR